MSIAQNIAAVRRRIEAASRRSDRDPASIRLVGASSLAKGVTDAMVEEAMAAGLRDFGENVIQEAQARFERMGEGAAAATWHFIGHLQTNKVPAALKLFDIIHSVDSLRLAEQLSRRATRPVRILLEVNVSGEASKYGLAPSEVAGTVAAVANLPNIELAGLMTVAPAVPDPETVRPVFCGLRELARANGLQELSMGMTDDFEVAVEEGATMVRVGRALFRGTN